MPWRLLLTRSTTKNHRTVAEGFVVPKKSICLGRGVSGLARLCAGRPTFAIFDPNLGFTQFCTLYRHNNRILCLGNATIVHDALSTASCYSYNNGRSAASFEFPRVGGLKGAHDHGLCAQNGMLSRDSTAANRECLV